MIFEIYPSSQRLSSGKNDALNNDIEYLSCFPKKVDISVVQSYYISIAKRLCMPLFTLDETMKVNALSQGVTCV